MNIIDLILWPIRWAIEAVMVIFHQILTFLGLPGHSGIAWVLSIVGLVLVVRAALIPVFMRQVRSQRRMMIIGPEIKKIQARYRAKGRKDMLSRQAMTREIQAMYRKHQISPMASLMPMFFQMPIFIGLYQSINSAQLGHPGVGLLTENLSQEFNRAKLFGSVSLHDSFANNWNLWTEGGHANFAVIFTAAILTIVMTSVQLISQIQIAGKNLPEATKDTPQYKMQRAMLYFLPLMFLIMGITFPVGILVYWTTSNTWTAAQQAIMIYRNPTPGSVAHKAWQERQRSKGKLPEPPPPPPKQQRQQPVSKKRARKKGS